MTRIMVSVRSSEENQPKHYDVAISFAGEDRHFAKALADALTRRNVSVFYDEYEKASLWGLNLYTHLSDVYRNQAQYCILLLSEHYAKKVWTRHEREAAQARAFDENKAYILPVRLDETQIPGVLPTIGYVRWPPEDETTIAGLVLTKLTGAAEAGRTAVGSGENFHNRGTLERYCSGCGAVPGKATKCTAYNSHVFVPTPSHGVYCSGCGAVPGEATKCTAYNSHAFVPL